MISPDAPLHVIQDTASLIGEGSIPALILILGGNLLKDINNEMPIQSSYFNPNNRADGSQPESIVTEEPVNSSGPTGYISNEEEDCEDDSANINENDGSQESSDEETDPEQSAPRERVRYDEGDG
eukprot:XP_015572589.1 uncharacterized protein LOC107260946 isoform X2 [Ricinus communis]